MNTPCCPELRQSAQVAAAPAEKLTGKARLARNFFPCGLCQPSGAYRFGLEALMLACMFSVRDLPVESKVAADLGAGCGVAGLALALRIPGLNVLALESQPELCRAALCNARSLGLEGRFAVLRADLAAPSLARACCDLILANPPFYVRGAGRMPASGLRRAALFGDKDCLDIFCRAAAWALKPGGRLGMVFTAAREDDLLSSLRRAGLAPVRLVPLAPRAGEPPSRVLAEARHTEGLSVRTETVREKALALHQGRGRDSRFSDDALAFCPFLERGAPLATGRPGAEKR